MEGKRVKPIVSPTLQLPSTGQAQKGAISILKQLHNKLSSPGGTPAQGREISSKNYVSIVNTGKNKVHTHDLGKIESLADKSVNTSELSKVPQLLNIKQVKKAIQPGVSVTETNVISESSLKNGLNTIYVYDFSKMLPHPGRIEKPAVSTSVVPVANETDQSNVSTQQSTDKAAETTNQIESQVTPIANQMILNPDQIVIGPPKETFKCAYCEYTSHNKSYLKQHVDLVHTADRPYKCPYCDYAGKRSHSLREHLIVHSNERPFQCTHCNATFRKKGHLTNHEKLHQKTVNCQLCQMSFPSSDIELHLKEHHKVKGHQKKVEISKEVEKRLEKVQDTASRLNASKVYVCSECKAMFKDFSLFVEHAKIHSTNKTIDSAKTKKVPAKEVVQDRSYLKGMKCTDCGFVSLSQEDMTKHLWTHINADADPVPVSSAQTQSGSSKGNDPNLLASDDSSKMIQHMVTPKDSGEGTYKKGKQPAISSEKLVAVPASSVRNTDGKSPNTSAEAKDKTVLVPTLKDGSLMMPVASQSKSHVQEASSEQPIYVGKILPGKPSEMPFVQDDHSARFRCTICGYTCEFQRTIKAHIWKHSGNKDIDYPTFQNGPLSIYDDWTPYVVENKTPAGAVLPNASSQVNQDRSVEEAATDVPKKLCPTVETIKVKSVISPVAPALASFLQMRAKQKATDTVLPTPTLKLECFSDEIKSDDDVQKAKNAEITTDIVQNDTVKSDSKDNTSNESVITLTAETQEEVEICEAIVSIAGIESEKAPVVDDREIFDLAQKRKSPASSTEEEGEMQQAAKRFCLEDNGNETVTGVVVEPVDSLTSDSYTGLRSEMNSPRPEEAVHDQDSGVASVSLGSPRSISINKPPRDEYQDVADDSEGEGGSNDVQIASDVDSKRRRTARQRTTSESMAESAVTLLSLLQKGPNRNPACPESISDSIGSEITVESSNTTTTYENESKQKSGISSSLLAVIEQLRERSKDSEILEADDTVAGRKSLKRKIKRESQERLVCIEGMENIEKVYENKTEKYRCKLCHYSNTSTSLLLQHMRLHKEKKPSECSLCEFVASSSEDLQDHMIKHCKVRTYQCKLCPSAFNYKSQLRAHMRAHNDKEVFVCDECDFESNNPTTFRNHVRGHSEKKLYKCIVCEKRFVSKVDLKTHKKGECAKQKSFSCDECDFVAIGPHEQRIHAKVHAKEFNCAYCDFVTTSISKFQNHTKAHEEQTSLKCAFCDFPAVSTRSLKSHMKRHINDQRFVQQPLEQYKCNLCGYVCHHLPSLKSHMWRHASDASYSYQFTNEVINAAIDYDCRLDAQGCKESDIAEFSQTIRRKLKERLERQGEESDVKAVCWVTFRCCQCGFETINKAQLSMHMKTHSDVIKWTLQVSPM